MALFTRYLGALTDSYPSFFIYALEYGHVLQCKKSLSEIAKPKPPGKAETFKNKKIRNANSEIIGK